MKKYFFDDVAIKIIKSRIKELENFQKKLGVSKERYFIIRQLNYLLDERTPNEK